jgi:hypothetical protein
VTDSNSHPGHRGTAHAPDQDPTPCASVSNARGEQVATPTRVAARRATNTHVHRAPSRNALVRSREASHGESGAQLCLEEPSESVAAIEAELAAVEKRLARARKLLTDAEAGVRPLRRKLNAEAAAIVIEMLNGNMSPLEAQQRIAAL